MSCFATQIYSVYCQSLKLESEFRLFSCLENCSNWFINYWLLLLKLQIARQAAERRMKWSFSAQNLLRGKNLTRGNPSAQTLWLTAQFSESKARLCVTDPLWGFVMNPERPAVNHHLCSYVPVTSVQAVLPLFTVWGAAVGSVSGDIITSVCLCCPS